MMRRVDDNRLELKVLATLLVLNVRVCLRGATGTT